MRRRLLKAVVMAATSFGTAAMAQAAPDLNFEGELRVRYESLGGQFRLQGTGGDQVLLFRTLALAEADFGEVAAGVEVQDSRGYLDDRATPLSTSLINPLDLLQAYVRLDLPGPLGFDAAELTLGRQTVSIGSRRVIERVEFANVIFSYTGAHWAGRSARGDELNALLVVPVGRHPTSHADLQDNLLSGDEEAWGRRFWGLHYRRKDAFGAALPDVWAEAFLYGLEEQDRTGVPTPNRDYLQPGARVYRAPRPGRLDFDVEASYRTGSRRLTSAATDVRDLDVSASTLHAAVGYTFSDRWRTRISGDYDFASGDGDPNDGRFDQYERLFGSRRTDLGHTSLFGPWTPANISAPGFRVELAPGGNWDARVAYKAGYLAEARDAWVVARIRDPTGRSGQFVGYTIDARTRVRLLDRSVTAELGASAFIAGDFAKRAPGSPGRDSAFVYLQLLHTF